MAKMKNGASLDNFVPAITDATFNILEPLRKEQIFI